MLTLGHKLCGLLLFFVATSLAEPVTTRTIEVSVVTDWETVSSYTSIDEIESIISSTFVHASRIFEDSLDLNLKITYLDIPTTETEDIIADHTHPGFLSNSLIDYRNDNPNHRDADVTVLFTKRLLSTGTGNYLGFVHRIGSICSSISVAIVKLTDNGLDYLTLAHELGHVLGAAHDGEGPCEGDPTTGFLMSSSVFRGGVALSQCSIDKISSTIETSGQCLLEDNVAPPPPITPPPVTTDEPFGGSGSMDIMFLLTLFIMVVITTLSTRADLNAGRAQRRNNVFCKPEMSTGNSRRRTRH
jgi:hypothetical protein